MATQITSDNFAEYFDSRMEEKSAAIENEEEVEIVDTLPDSTTIPLVLRSSGVPTGYGQIAVEKLAEEIAPTVASYIDESDLPFLGQITQEQFDTIFNDW